MARALPSSSKWKEIPWTILAGSNQSKWVLAGVDTVRPVAGFARRKKGNMIGLLGEGKVEKANLVPGASGGFGD